MAERDDLLLEPDEDTRDSTSGTPATGRNFTVTADKAELEIPKDNNCLIF